MNKPWHFRNLTNPKIKRLYNLLLKKSMVTPVQIAKECETTCPSTIVSELRACLKNHGQNVECIRVDKGNKRHHFYRLTINQ